jgi:redox-sensitive bicupin YhaK (pirin superfamily)
VNDHAVTGAISGLATEPGYLDITVNPADQLSKDLSKDLSKELSVGVPEGHTALIYVYEGELRIGTDAYQIKAGSLARLSLTGDLVIQAGAKTRLLIITGKPIGEPIVQRGPFVMNTAEEIHQAIRDYTEGKLVAA